MSTVIKGIYAPNLRYRLWLENIASWWETKPYEKATHFNMAIS